MSANRGKNTSPEIRLRSALFANGMRGYRLHKRGIPGRPDILFPSHRLAIFVNGCFWHRCPKCALPLPKSHQEFWREKFGRNVRRDRNKTEQLKRDGYSVLVLWECDIDRNLNGCINKIRKKLG